jgi:prevent-host-death family protein
MRSWQAREAKARFAELLRDAARSGPQQITVRGRATAVVLSTEAYERLRGRKPSLTAFLHKSPLVGVELDLTRDRSPARRAVFRA